MAPFLIAIHPVLLVVHRARQSTGEYAMKTKVIGALGGLLLALPLLVQATTISWDSGNSAYIGLADSTTSSAACSTGDLCALTQTWDLGGGLSVTVSAYDGAVARPYDSTADDAPLYVWHDANPAVGGLGSAPYSDLGDSSADNNTGKESLHLRFSSAVSIDSLFFNGNHTSFSGYTFLFYGMGSASSSMDDVYNDGTISLGGLSLTDLWIEPDWSYLPTDEWYLSGLSFNVPEPMPLALFALGLFGLVWCRRRV
jgi:hypothetical protein